MIKACAQILLYILSDFRVIWACLVLGGIAYFGVAISQFMDVYAKQLVSTKLRVKNAANLTVRLKKQAIFWT